MASASNQTILITGGSGFVASHVLNSFLTRGYHVRTTVRSKEKAQAVKDAHSRYAQQLELAIVPDVAVAGAHDEAVKGVHGVIHTAAPFHFNVDDNKTQLLDPAIRGTTSILTSIKKNAPQVKRVVVTSSFAANYDMNKGMWPEHTYSELDWNPVTMKEAEESPPPVAYMAAKTFAERAAYDFVEKEKPKFTVAAICPPLIFGPVPSGADINKLNTSSAELWQFANGSLKGQKLPDTAFPAFVDVRDVGEAHLKAFEGGKQDENERFLTISGQYQNPDIVKIIRDNFPDLRDNVPDPDSTPYVDTYKVDNSKSVKELGMKFNSLEKVVVDSIKSYQALEKS